MLIFLGRPLLTQTKHTETHHHARLRSNSLAPRMGMCPNGTEWKGMKGAREEETVTVSGEWRVQGLVPGWWYLKSTTQNQHHPLGVKLTLQQTAHPSGLTRKCFLYKSRILFLAYSSINMLKLDGGGWLERKDAPSFLNYCPAPALWAGRHDLWWFTFLPKTPALRVTPPTIQAAWDQHDLPWTVLLPQALQENLAESRTSGDNQCSWGTYISEDLVEITGQHNHPTEEVSDSEGQGTQEAGLSAGSDSHSSQWSPLPWLLPWMAKPRHTSSRNQRTVPQSSSGCWGGKVLSPPDTRSCHPSSNWTVLAPQMTETENRHTASAEFPPSPQAGSSAPPSPVLHLFFCIPLQQSL